MANGLRSDWEPASRPVDLRSDAVTRPTPEMWEMMRSDPLDWSRAGDRTAEELERQVADLLGKPAGLFVPTGTMANTLAALAWTTPGDHFLVDRHAHVLRAEGDAYDRVARIVPHSVEGRDGHPGAGQVAEALATDDRISLVWLENTHTYAGGTVAPPDVDHDLAAILSRSGVKAHLDGARLWNAAVASGRTLVDLSGVADSVDVNLSKGLGCPGGSVLCGPVEFVATARRLMSALGGGLAQTGLLAACGLVALRDFESVVRRDHVMAATLAKRLQDTDVDVVRAQTNIVFVSVVNAEAARVRLARRGVLAFVRDPSTLRFVTHRGIGEAEIDRVVAAAGVLV